MQDLNIAASTSSPSIQTDWSAGMVRLGGDSYPENAFELFRPLLDWVGAYLGSDHGPLQLELRLLYLNTSSIRIMMDVLDQLEAAHGQGRAVSLRWFYDSRNARVADLAEEFREDCSFPFEIVAE
ncbi:biofilm regulation phosphoprotein SiaC [Chitinilyticum litopenaei]|uniref:biofilm regulation phosphoprotein SiaC n=1 Tax=Chitinilyticum litopenaei TaxID=1121276 RepID=UPI000421AFFF|nr:biofilm regulation phosphoprotein SiaC [Chitinilyticum litopenaei]